MIKSFRLTALRSAVVACVLFAGLVAAASVPVYAGKDCSGSFTVTLSDGRTFGGDQARFSVPVGAGLTAQVRGKFVSYDVELDTFTVRNYTLQSDITGNQRVTIFARKTPLHGRTLTSNLSIDINSEQMVLERSGSGIDMKIQSKDCSEGGIFQMEPDQTIAVEHELTALFSYCVDALGRVLVVSASNPFVGRESPETAALVFPTPTNAIVGTRLSRWQIQGGGRMGFVTGEDAVEPLVGTGCSARPNPNPTPTPGATPTPTPGATPTPTPGATPSPTPDNDDDDDNDGDGQAGETRVFANLVGAVVNGQTIKGKAEFRRRLDGSTRFKTEVENVNRPAGTVFNVLVDGNRVGQIVLGPFREGELELNTNDGQFVPNVVNGTTVTVTDQTGAVLVTGSFNQTAPAPSPNPTPTPQPSPTPGNGTEQRFETTLGGARINGVLPQGVAVFRLRADGSRRFKVEVEDMNLPLGTVLTVLYNGAEVGRITLGNFFEAELERNTNDGQFVPTFVPGASVAVADQTGAILLAGAFPATATISHPIDDAAFFARQQYVDFLNRAPDNTGLNNWVQTLAGCPGGGYGTANPTCDRVHVSKGFFQSQEFQTRGYWVYRFYEVGLDRRPRYNEFLPDMVKIGGAQSPAEEAASKQAFLDAFVQRPEFTAKFNQAQFQDASAFVSELERVAEVALANRAQLIADLREGRKTRAQVLREVVESREVEVRFFNEAFVTMQYFGYLRRDPDQLGFEGWVRTINRTGDYRHMIFGFLYSTEYRGRFGQP
ncbi:MAG TPA: hypothetical protein VGV59_00475 [Pyrinomonadaceae bacterium]|nr:hypothetical protein [Pyrinomonadaceae bacterium]